MTIVEALKSGQPFRRTKWPIELGFIVEDRFRTFEWERLLNSPNTHAPLIITPSDVIAEDWELKQGS